MTHDDIEHPIMPTGSGVADLMVAREQDALENDDGAAISPEQTRAGAALARPADAIAESEAHPS